ncbi:MAG: 3'-5' exonuclease [Heliobacteriaceae bacterium]|jgi:DNA polymerase III epsilon subunit family exonuclease|nr:3'-5' exonuclease [Heliobacteriaceae bacterium]
MTEKFPADYTVLDIETTGLSYYGHEIIELCALRVRNDEVTEEFCSLIKPDVPINGFTTRLTGITNDMLESAPDIKYVLPQFVDFTGDDIVLGHNVKFDISFIRHNCKKYLNRDFNNESVDTMQLVKEFCKLKSHSLESAAKYYKIDSKGHHRALFDCKLTFEIYQRLKTDFSAQQLIILN